MDHTKYTSAYWVIFIFVHLELEAFSLEKQLCINSHISHMSLTISHLSCSGLNLNQGATMEPYSACQTKSPTIGTKKKSDVENVERKQLKQHIEPTFSVPGRHSPEPTCSSVSVLQFIQIPSETENWTNLMQQNVPNILLQKMRGADPSTKHGYSDNRKRWRSETMRNDDELALLAPLVRSGVATETLAAGTRDQSVVSTWVHKSIRFHKCRENVRKCQKTVKTVKLCNEAVCAKESLWP